MQWLARLRNWLTRNPQREARTRLTQLQAFDLLQKLVEFQKIELGGGMQAELIEAEACSGSGPRMNAREAAKFVEAQGVQLKERLLELELALDNIGWRRQLAYADLEFSRQGIQGIIKISRLYYLKNPLVKRGVEISGSYVWARGFEIRADDQAAQDTIDDFLQANASEVGHLGMMEKEQTLRTDGNLFITLFPSPTGGVTLRTIDATEIQDIITDPDDASVPQYYRRMWTRKVFDLGTGAYETKTVEMWYPALDYEPDVKPAMIGRNKVEWNSPILHVKIGGLPKWLFGCPDIYAALDWARAYKAYLEDWCTINKALSRFLWDAKTKGGNQTIQALQSVLNTSVGSGGDTNQDFVDRNPPPTTGAAFIHGEGTELNPIKTAGITTNPEQGRRVGMMVGSAMNIPETMLFGDASTGSLATAQSLDRPTELSFMRRQEHWREIWLRILRFVLRVSADSPGGKLREAKGDPDFAKHMVVKMVRRERGVNGRITEVWEADKRKNGDITLSVKFPAILEHDIAQMVSAIVQAATLGGFQPGGTMDMRRINGLLGAEVGIEDVDKMNDEMYPPNDYDPTNYADNGKADAPDPATVPPPAAHPHLVAPSFGAEADRNLLTAVSQLKETLRQMKHRAE